MPTSWNLDEEIETSLERSMDYLEDNTGLSLDFTTTSSHQTKFRTRPTKLDYSNKESSYAVLPVTRDETLLSAFRHSNLGTTSTLSEGFCSKTSNKYLENDTTISSQKSTESYGQRIRSYFMKKSFEIQAFIVWLFVGVPGILVTLHYYLQVERNQDTSTIRNHINVSQAECHEVKNDWKNIVSWSQYAIQGISIAIIGTFGLFANILSVHVLLRCRENRNFHRLLAGLAIVDTVLIVILVLEMSVVGVFMKKEPLWYIISYPYIIHPGRGIVQTTAIYMVVAVSTERYRAVCHPLVRRQAYYKYIVVVISLSTTIEFPRFLEMKLNKDNSQYWTTDLMENPDYVQFSSYWNDIIVTGLLPLILLCYMNLRVFVKIKASSEYALRFVSSKVPIGLNEPDEDSSDTFPRGSIKKKKSSSPLLNCHKQPKMKSGAQLVRQKKEKSAAILVTIIVVFLLCHIHRLSLRLYEMASPESSIYEHYRYCDKKGLYHVPVANYFLTQLHYLFLAINSSVNFIIYCAMGQHFRKQLCKMWDLNSHRIKSKYFCDVK